MAHTGFAFQAGRENAAQSGDLACNSSHPQSAETKPRRSVEIHTLVRLCRHLGVHADLQLPKQLKLFHVEETAVPT